MREVTIVGAGLSGLTAALDLARRGCRITVVDRGGVSKTSASQEDLDSRIYTIRPGLIRYLTSLGVWQRVDVRRLQPVLGMRVKGSGKKSVLDFDSLKCGLESLATTVEEGCLKEELIRACGVNGNIDYRSDCEFENVEYQTDAILVKTSRGGIPSKLLIAADGLQSNVRNALNIDFVVKDYQSSGIVANFETKRSHGGYAHQVFSDEGILALLPLPGNRVSMVWSVPETFAKNVLSAGEEALSDLVFRRFDILGSLRCITPPRSFPLRKGVARRYTADRVALVGDALRHIHPLAGQGLNLGIADARALGELIGASRTEDPGSPQILRRYARARREETIVFSEFTDLLSGLFSRNKLWSNIGNTGFRLVNQCPPLKRYFVNRAVE
ncbi:MAG: FAD-dependent oxidoreductase [Burkholderiales bacterium]|jgi:2-octaprenylphenol hydroxylase